MVWDNMDDLQNSNSYSIGKTSPILILGIMVIIAPWILDIMFNIPGWAKEFFNVIGIFMIVIGALLSMMNR